MNISGEGRQRKRRRGELARLLADNPRANAENNNARVAELEAQLAIKNAECEQLQSQMIQLVADYESKTAKFVADYDRKVEQAMDGGAASGMELAMLRSECARLHEREQQLMAERNSDAATMAAVLDKVKLLQAKIDERAATSASEFAKMKAECDRRQKREQELLAEIEHCRRADTGTTGELIKLSAEFAKLRKSEHDMTVERNKLIKSEQELIAECDRLRHDAAMQTKIAIEYDRATSKAVDEGAKLAKQLRATIDEQNAKINMLAGVVNEQKIKIGLFEQARKTESDELTKRAKTIEDLHARLAIVERTAKDSVEEARAAARQDKISYDAQIAFMTKQADDMHRQLDEEAKHNSNLRHELGRKSYHLFHMASSLGDRDASQIVMQTQVQLRSFAAVFCSTYPNNPNAKVFMDAMDRIASRLTTVAMSYQGNTAMVVSDFIGGYEGLVTGVANGRASQDLLDELCAEFPINLEYFQLGELCDLVTRVYSSMFDAVYVTLLLSGRIYKQHPR